MIAPDDPAPARPRELLHVLAYGASVPERSLRVLAAGVGTVGLLATRLLPAPLRKGKLYRLAIERQIRTLADDIGQASLFPGQPGLDGRTAVRLGVGGAIDNALVLALHASPLWLLFAATDVCGAARALVSDVGQELHRAGLMRPGSRLDRLDDVLEGLARLSDRTSEALDLPPISLEEMRGTVATLKEEMAGLTSSTLRVADVEGLVNEVRGLAAATHRSVLEVMGAAALGALRSTGGMVKATAIGSKAALAFLGRGLEGTLDDYRASLDAVRRLGFTGALAAFVAPWQRSRRRLFAYRFLSGTELVLSAGRWRSAPWRLR